MNNQTRLLDYVLQTTLVISRCKCALIRMCIKLYIMVIRGADLGKAFNAVSESPKDPKKQNKHEQLHNCKQK